MAFTLITVTGTFPRPDGSVAQGTGTATLSHRLTNGTSVIEPEPIGFVLNGSGQVVAKSLAPLTLEANDDPATTPPGSYYSFELQLDSAPIDPFTAVIPHLAAAGTVDLSALIPALP